MKDYYANLRACIDTYNIIVDVIKTHSEPTTEEQDEFLQNYPLHFAHALIKDVGYGQISREELETTADIILDVLR